MVMFSFFETTVDNIISDFNKVVDKLEALGQKHLTDANNLKTEVVKLQVDADEAINEYNRAVKIAANIRKLVEDV